MAGVRRPGRGVARRTVASASPSSRQRGVGKDVRRSRVAPRCGREAGQRAHLSRPAWDARRAIWNRDLRKQDLHVRPPRIHRRWRERSASGCRPTDPTGPVRQETLSEGSADIVPDLWAGVRPSASATSALRLRLRRSQPPQRGGPVIRTHLFGRASHWWMSHRAHRADNQEGSAQAATRPLRNLGQGSEAGAGCVLPSSFGIAGPFVVKLPPARPRPGPSLSRPSRRAA